jgi:hypothetical protein
MIFKTVFDAAHQGYGIWAFLGIGLILMAVGILLVGAPGLMLKFLPLGLQGQSRKIFGWVFLSVAVTFTVVIFANTYSAYQATVTALDHGQYSVIEGQVTNFVPMPYEGHSDESFVVKGHRFSYSDYKLTPGFHNTASHGGPIHEGLYVRVTYVGGLILRLEIAE